MTPTHELLTTSEAAKYLKMSISWLEKDRLKDEPLIKITKIGRRVLYRKIDLMDYIDSLSES